MTFDPAKIESVRSREPSRRARAEERSSGATACALDSLLPESGWHVGPSVIDPTLIEQICALLEIRRDQLEDQFARWAGTPIESREDLKQASLRLEEFDAIGIPKDLRHFLTGEFDLGTRLLAEMRALLSEPSLKMQLCELLKTTHFLVHYPPMVRFKVAELDTGLVPLHQDSAYNAHLRDFVTVWIPLEEVNDASGGLHVYSGSHKRGCVTHRTDKTWASTTDLDLAEHDLVHVEMHAGDGLFFSSHLFHQSAPYTSRKSRFSIDLRVFRNAEDTTKSYYDPFEDRVVRKD